ncbi:acyl-homoserine-lactone synthase [Oceanicella actignis]|uniref:Acyl-homoserine-lactone synthase n=1 Tax=Oceanicella actignis TaxID=1189325 RepID=A0A1M7T317_9RHOB|nr:acyl-homoserine-lactone synthase [Oceanicella actignis]TYO88853.1 acyl homoserine lactone synthase [Oceanicella actignis]SET39597.1 N-acyl-L-homoserine lactone synthetase [Oceanicella actignis]SHN65067.1 acyl homoserine lactone synthase [Oceanicella actignis]
MIRFVYGSDLPAFPRLADSMFRDRAAQFRDRRAWDLRIDENGWETDEYDRINPLYCIYELPDGTHGGSGRLAPTTAGCMINDHFSDILGGTIESPLIWESTRFVVSPRISGGMQAARRISTALMLAGIEVGLRYGLTHYIGCYDPPMRRIWRNAGWPAEDIGARGTGRDQIIVGVWEISEQVRQNILDRAPEGLRLGAIPPIVPHAAIPALARAA